MSLSLPVFVFVSVGYMHTYIYSRSLNKYPSLYTYTVQCVQEKSKRPVEGTTSWDFEKYDCAKIIGMILPSCFSKYSCFFFKGAIRMLFLWHLSSTAFLLFPWLQLGDCVERANTKYTMYTHYHIFSRSIHIARARNISKHVITNRRKLI